MKPAATTFFAALFINLGLFLLVFGMKGFVLIGLPLWHLPFELEQGAAAVSLLGGAWLAAGLFGAYPDWRLAFWTVTGMLLAGQAGLFVWVSAGSFLR